MTWPGADVDVATNTVGKPLAHVEMRIADEQGKFILNQVFALCIVIMQFLSSRLTDTGLNERDKETLWNKVKLAKSMFVVIPSSPAMSRYSTLIILFNMVIKNKSVLLKSTKVKRE